MARPSHGSRLQPIVAVGLDRVQVELLVRGLSLSPPPFWLALANSLTSVASWQIQRAHSLSLLTSLIEFIVIVVGSR